MVRMSRTAALVCAVLFLFFGVSAAFAQHAANSSNDGVNNGQQAAANSPGHLRQATREEQAELAALSTNLSQSTEGLVVVTRGDGSQMVDLQDRFQDAMLVRPVGPFVLVNHGLPFPNLGPLLSPEIPLDAVLAAVRRRVRPRGRVLPRSGENDRRTVMRRTRIEKLKGRELSLAALPRVRPRPRG